MGWNEFNFKFENDILQNYTPQNFGVPITPKVR